MKKLIALACLLSVAALPAIATPVAIQNNSFEVPTSSGTFNTVFAPGSIPGWNVTAGSIDHIWAYWPAADGQRSLDMDGLSAGTIQQVLNLGQGGNLAVNFWMAGNPDGNASGNTLKTLEVSLLSGAGPAQTFTFNSGLATRNNMGWVSHTANFTVPTAGAYTLQFASLTPGAYGPALDNVTASIPDSATTVALLGLALAAVAGIRRRLIA